MNWLLLLFLSTAMVGEAFMSQGFEKNYVGVMLLFALVFLSGILLLAPVMLRTKFKNQFRDIVIPVVIGLGLMYMIAAVYILAVEFIPDLIFYSLTILLFMIFIVSCFYIAFVNKHPKNIFVFIVGICYSLVVVGSFIYELFYPTVMLIGVVNLLEITAQFSFVFYITHISEIAKEKQWFL